MDFLLKNATILHVLSPVEAAKLRWKLSDSSGRNLEIGKKKARASRNLSS